MVAKCLAIEYSGKQENSHQLMFLSLTPGGVKTDMNPDGPLTPAESVGNMFKVIDRLPLSESGSFYSWKGEKLPW